MENHYFLGGQMNYQWAIFHSYVANYQQVSVFLTVHLVLDTLETELQSPPENLFNGRHASCMFFCWGIHTRWCLPSYVVNSWPCIYIYIYICMLAYTYLHIHIYIYICKCICKSIHITP